MQLLAETARISPTSPAFHTTFGRFAASAAANSTMNSDNPPVIRVEQAHRPQIGKFDGTMADWPAFRDLFIAEVHDRPIDPVRKLLLLKDACTGKAADTLGAWQPTAGNYQLAWDAMMASYNDEYHVVHGILAKLHSTGKQESETHDAYRAILDSLTSCTRQLRASTTSAALDDQIWIHHGKQRLPDPGLDAWEQYRNQFCSGALPTLEDFKRFLELKAKARRKFVQPDVSHKSKLESGGADGRGKSGQSQSRFKPPDKSARGQSPAGKVGDRGFGFTPLTQCIMPGCEQVHYLGQCRLFSTLSPSGRMQVVNANQLCKCCLTPSLHEMSERKDEAPLPAVPKGSRRQADNVIKHPAIAIMTISSIDGLGKQWSIVAQH